eukprot:CAMPEP_0119110900 /NCGR_PEP_ID=MMETSP1180-20130426/32724_1 /TAXON_ID=3052 ORGANISM="Chlamydomonas cf sp, Strain CCMP681" /NCGR_SAMPLE_ID=MMETSP1180 /ASSEMBLY_ACC=CAM_ASM_000741 /LENGTH=384 /DNA_ID=CAMNT_0007097549 /DNA_START=78 /DNA_END=1232 /DNA_ORIENTATION=-
MTGSEKVEEDSLLGDFVSVSDTQEASSATKLPAAATGVLSSEEVQSVVKGFGSPHQPLPGSPMEHPAKQLDFDLVKGAATPGSPETPVLPPSVLAASKTQGLHTPPAASAASHAHSQGETEVIDYNTFIRDTLLWVNKVRSTVYVLGGLLLIWAVNCALSSHVTLVTGVCWALLAQLALNFVRSFINRSFQERCTYFDSAWTATLLSYLSSSIKGAAAIHDRHMQGGEAGKTLLIIGALWVVSIFGRGVGFTTLAAGLWIAAFTLPRIYTKFQAKIDKATSDISSIVKSRLGELDPKIRAALVVVPILVAGYTMSTADLLVAVLALAAYGRACMAPAQVDRLNAAVAPVSHTVSKVSNTVSRIASDAVAKYELTPTPSKKAKVL